MKKQFLIGLVCLLGTLAAIANSGEKPENDQKNNKEEPDVSGVVIKSENGKPLKDVTVAVYHSVSNKKEQVTISNASGNYLLMDLKAGISYKLVFEKEGYRKVVKEKVLLKAKEIFLLNIEMPEEDVFDLMPSPHHFFGD